MARILFLAHRYPYPPNKGDKIRAFHIAEHLLRSHEVSLGFTVTPGDAAPDMSWARGFSAVYCGRITTADRLARTAIALVSGAPLSVAAFAHGGLRRWVARHVREWEADLTYVFSSAMAQYVPAGAPAIVDFVDVDSEKWRQYEAAQSGIRASFFGMEGRRLLAFDRAQAARARASLFVSDDERRVFDRLSPETKARHWGIANGVDVAFFDPASVRARTNDRPTIVFVGVMDYWPNVDAVKWFARDILPLITAKNPHVRFQIVGSKPSAAVAHLRDLPGVEVTGAVDDIRPYVAAAAVVVAPLRIARGIQNKVLEGMAMARPVVATTGALEGIKAEKGQDLLVGDTPEAIAEAVLSALEPGTASRLGQAARAFVLKRHEWGTNLAKLDDLIAATLSAR